MLISDIKPYERNARHNDKAIPKVAESIRKFGLRGSIVLESRDNPVIVCGHTRVAAMKSLGWTEIPDDHIEYCFNGLPTGSTVAVSTIGVKGDPERERLWHAGIVYGIDSIPAEWLAKLRGKDVIDACLFA